MEEWARDEAEMEKKQGKAEGEGKKEPRVEEREEEKETQQRKVWEIGREEKRRVVWVISPRAGGLSALHLWIGHSRNTEQEGVLGVWWAGQRGLQQRRGVIRTIVLQDWNKTVLFWFPC